MNHIQIKKLVIRVHSTIERGTPIDIKKLLSRKGNEKTQNKIDTKLKVAKDPLSKIFLLLFLFNSFKVFHSQLINLFM